MLKESYGESDFLKGVEIYDGKYIRLKNPLDACLVPKLNKKQYKKIAKEILQANTIPRYVQAPAEQAEEVIISYLERLVGEPDWPEYRELIDHVKGQFRLARNTAKKVIVDAGWSDVRGVYAADTPQAQANAGAA